VCVCVWVEESALRKPRQPVGERESRGERERETHTHTWVGGGEAESIGEGRRNGSVRQL